MIDLAHQLVDTAEGAVPNCLVGDQHKEALHLIEPGSVDVDELEVPARPRGQPGVDLGALVCCVVIHDQMDVQLRRYGRLDAAQKGQELMMPGGAAYSRSALMNSFSLGKVNP